MIEIRTATLVDCSIIQSVAQDTWPDTFGAILSEQQIAYMLDRMYSLAALDEQMTAKGHHFLLALEDDNCLGYVSYELAYKGMPKTKIHKLYMLPAAQGKGIGRQLIEAVQVSADLAAAPTLALNVNRDNKAVQFYEHLGFEVVGREDIDIGEGFLMEDFVLERMKV